MSSHAIFFQLLSLGPGTFLIFIYFLVIVIVIVVVVIVVIFVLLFQVSPPAVVVTQVSESRNGGRCLKM